MDADPKIPTEQMNKILTIYDALHETLFKMAKLEDINAASMFNGVSMFFQKHFDAFFYVADDADKDKMRDLIMGMAIRYAKTTGSTN